MSDLPLLVVGFDNMILLVCPEAPILKPQTNPVECDLEFKLEKTIKIKKRAKRSQKTKIHKMYRFQEAI